MSLAFLLYKMQQLKEMMKMKPCKRCRLYFDPIKQENCPHCSELDDAALAKMLKKRASQKKGHKILGGWFYLIAIFISILLILSLF